MQSGRLSDRTLAATITRTASKQTYYTIRLLADTGLVDDAYRAYAYFRWLDDWLDQEPRPRSERLAFVRRQQALIDGRAHPELLATLTPQEALLADLIQRDTQEHRGLQIYISNMMAVMAFDADRRGHLISQRELNDYTHWLAVAVTEALHYFIGHDCAAPCGEIRYMAVSGAHIAHMLRDALEDAQAGYYNIPSEVIAANGITPWDVESNAYRDWVKARVREARACFRIGRAYLDQVENLRCRIAGYTYIHRFEAVLDSIEQAGYVLQARYPQPIGGRRALDMIGWALWMALNDRRHAHGVSTHKGHVKL
jgi:hypothetical protein